MKVTLLTENLKKGLGIVARAAISRSTLPVLGNVLLQTIDGRLRLACSNLEMTIIAHVGAMVEADGAITVPVKTINDLISSCSDDKVALTLDSSTHTLTLVSGRVKANIKGIAAEEFPLIDTAFDKDADYTITMPAKDVISSAKRVLPAVSADMTRPTLMSVQWALNGSSKMAATDGFRLSLMELSGITNGDFAEALIPGTSLSELVRIADEEGDITVEFKENRVIFDMGSVILISQLIEGSYPDYSAIIPKHSNVIVQCDRSELKSACLAAAVFAREASNASTLKIEPAENGQSVMHISAIAPESGNNRTTIDCQVLTGSLMEITLNIKYLTDAIGTINGDVVELQMNSSMEPGVVTAPGSDAPVHVIMPVHFGK